MASPARAKRTAGSRGHSAESRGGKGGAGARARASGHAQPAACGGARCSAGCMYGREGAAAEKADSTPCAHAPAPAGYKAAAPAPPDKVASCDVTGRSCRCCSQRARWRARDTSRTPGSEKLRPAPPRHTHTGRRETHITVSQGRAGSARHGIRGALGAPVGSGEHAETFVPVARGAGGSDRASWARGATWPGTWRG